MIRADLTVRGTIAAAIAGMAVLLLGCADDETSAHHPPPKDAGPLGCEVGDRTEEGACIAPGIAADRCAAGFEADGRASCTPILPPEPCAPGTMAIPGETTCREVMPCPAAEHGEAPEEPTTLHVRADHQGPSDGSAAMPYTTIQAAVDAAVDGAVVAIAAGTYAESVEVMTHNVRLWGRCPALTVIVGDSGRDGAWPSLRLRGGRAQRMSLRELDLRLPRAVVQHRAPGALIRAGGGRIPLNDRVRS
jgi:hypothetical protein